MKLTMIESKIYDCFKLAGDKVLTRDEIYRSIFPVKGASPKGVTDYINTYICLMRKKGVNVQTVRGVGYRLAE